MSFDEIIIWIALGFGVPGYFLYDGLSSGVADYGMWRFDGKKQPRIFWMAMTFFIVIILGNLIGLLYNLTI